MADELLLVGFSVEFQGDIFTYFGEQFVCGLGIGVFQEAGDTFVAITFFDVRVGLAETETFFQFDAAGGIG